MYLNFFLILIKQNNIKLIDFADKINGLKHFKAFIYPK